MIAEAPNVHPALIMFADYESLTQIPLLQEWLGETVRPERAWLDYPLILSTKALRCFKCNNIALLKGCYDECIFG